MIMSSDSVPSLNGFRPKKLVVCCDGTWMNSNRQAKHGAPSNITRLAKRAILPVDSYNTPQVVFYQAGIGTGLAPSSKLLGGGTGRGFSDNVREAYAFLAVNYNASEKDHDRIFLTGFSRGAYTARNLGGILSQFGLLKKEHIDWFFDIFTDWQNAGKTNYQPLFWQNWSEYRKRRGEPGHTLKTVSKNVQVIDDYLEEYRKALLAIEFVREVRISAIGVFDTVGALGIPINPALQKIFGLPAFLHKYMWVDTRLNNNVRHAFQALALDEFRAPFHPSIWEKEDDCTTNIKQVWFAGAHSSIGGAYSDRDISNITLAWMMDQLSGDIFRKTGGWAPEDWLEFDQGYLTEQVIFNLDYQKTLNEKRPWAHGAIHDSLTLPHYFTGRRVRMPGRTRPSLPATEYFDPGRLMRNSNERIHCSVRLRYRSGRGFEKDPDGGIMSWSFQVKLEKWKRRWARLSKQDSAVNMLYDPCRDGPLHGWELHRNEDWSGGDLTEDLEGDKGVNTHYWEFVGHDKLLKDRRRILVEDAFGRHEWHLFNQHGEQYALDEKRGEPVSE